MVMTRIAVIEKDKCNPIGCGDFLCIKLCPMNRARKECIVKSDGKPRIDESICTGCAICQNRCPFFAISIINLPEELTKKPIHRYSENGFALYSLPAPIFGKVVGIIGVNGIGKSTAIKILAGVLSPNFGDFKSEKTNYDDLIAFFKGTEAQLFFEKVKKGEIKISYKLQQVDLIAKNMSGKVRELLKKVDEKGKLEEIAKELDITEILDNDIETISGGELQRVAIAAAVLKKANFYVFDEPTSYLDIKQRLKVSKFIKSLADDKTAVMVVEHDLIILDYMADLVHLLYGKEACYGIVSQPKSAKAGINTFLSGYLREENVRFRGHEIKFEAKPPTKKQSQNELVSWKGIEKQLGNFKLKAPGGIIYKSEVAGILGENGIGKTSFVKILAEEIKPDKGEINEKVRVSYKPQYLMADSDDIVMNVLKDATDKYSNQIITPLRLEPLLLKRLNELSGGELQRVSIALCLSRDAKLYLLDEPSAYLDVEQRLIVSKVIREFMEHKGCSAIIVDHDLLFIDYLSQNLIVFEGKPALEGTCKGPFSMEEGMNTFLKDLGLTFRRDPESLRPRANKPESQMDRKQKEEGRLYYG